MSKYLIIAGTAIIAFVLAIGLVNASTDEEILQFSAGVLAGESLLNDPSISINGDNLTMDDSLNEYSSKDVSSIGFRLQEMASATDTIVKQYPDRFTMVELRLHPVNGIGLIGLMRISVS
jgi:hypothetical protein